MTAVPKRPATGAGPSTPTPTSAPVTRNRRRGRADAGPFWLIRGRHGHCNKEAVLATSFTQQRQVDGELSPAAGFLIAFVALAFSTLEKTEVWPNRSRLLATFKAPNFMVSKVSHSHSRAPTVVKAAMQCNRTPCSVTALQEPIVACTCSAQQKP